jgi:hypothetical protein
MAELVGQFICPSLHRLGMLLTATYTLRNRCLADNKNIKAIGESELNLRRMHNLITRHRSICLRCKFNEALKGIAPKCDDLYSEVIPIKSAIMSRETLS